MQQMLHRLKVGKEMIIERVVGVCFCGNMMAFQARLVAGLTVQ
jgi:hypothetical protein